jgi:hypothetical protein
MRTVCGQPAADAVFSNPTNPLENIPLIAAGPDCKLDLCRCATFSDNTTNMQTYAPGQSVRMLAILLIPHEGPMNVSIVDTVTNTVVGPPLIGFASYADENLAQLPANNTDFEVTYRLIWLASALIQGSVQYSGSGLGQELSRRMKVVYTLSWNLQLHLRML